MPAMSNPFSLGEKAAAYDKVGTSKHEVTQALAALKQLRDKYPFSENLCSIEWLDPDRLYKVNPDEVGEFFQLLEKALRPVSYSNQSSSNIYRNARLQIGEFKKLLRLAVDDRRSLSEKVDAHWERIGGVGQDKLLPKRIIYCFNEEKGSVAPVFSNHHLRHFVGRIGDASTGQTKYYSLGQEYQHFTEMLLKAKNSLPQTKSWHSLYFGRFLYETYPPPDSERIGVNAAPERKIAAAVTNEQLDLQGFMRLLGELQKQGKIGGDKFREYRSLWTCQPSEREGLTQRLRKMLNP
ncbi:MAG: hypothetical protein NWE93_01245 [Candidatus Bathyarchaeota archaeon]|nr:hypothetical protein [Candidatus Bathyarchaeota archaeon]